MFLELHLKNLRLSGVRWLGKMMRAKLVSCYIVYGLETMNTLGKLMKL